MRIREDHWSLGALLQPSSEVPALCPPADIDPADGLWCCPRLDWLPTFFLPDIGGTGAQLQQEVVHVFSAMYVVGVFPPRNRRVSVLLYSPWRIVFFAVGLTSGRRCVTTAEGQAFADKHGLLFMEMSARNSAQVERAFIGTAERVSVTCMQRGHQARFGIRPAGVWL